MSVYVKLFGRRPHLGRATRTGAGVRKAAEDETALGGTPTWPTITNEIARPQVMNRRLIFSPIDPEGRCNLDVLARILRLMGISRFVLSMIPMT